MSILNPSSTKAGIPVRMEGATVDREAPKRNRWRLTILFAVTALVVILVALLVVNRVIGGLAERNLIRIAEENTVRDAHHIQAMIHGEHDMPMAPNATRTDLSPPMPVTLEQLAGPESILNTGFSDLVDGLNVAKVNLFDLEGNIAWSSDPGAADLIRVETLNLESAIETGASSKYGENRDIVFPDGTIRRVEVVETYIPLREGPSGETIGIMKISRDVSDDVALQVEDAKSAVLWTTVAAMGGLFLVLFGFIVTADVTIFRANRREVATVEEANRGLEARVKVRTQELVESNQRLVEARDRVVRSEKLAVIGQLAGGVAHDLRNPLGVITNAVYYVKRRLTTGDTMESNPRIPEFLDVVEEEVARSNQIITDLMDFARIRPPTHARVDLKAALEASLPTINEGSNIRLVKQLEEAPLTVDADGEHLYRVFMNLGKNAVEAMQGGGELTVTVRRKGGVAAVEFADTGVGISEADMKNIFEPLFTTKSHGTGLGLAVCQQIVTQHGGELSVESREGEGATFKVTLPISAEPLEGEEK